MCIRKRSQESLQVLHNTLFCSENCCPYIHCKDREPVSSDTGTRGWKKEVTKEKTESVTVSCSDTELERIMDKIPGWGPSNARRNTAAIPPKPPEFLWTALPVVGSSAKQSNWKDVQTRHLYCVCVRGIRKSL